MIGNRAHAADDAVPFPAQMLQSLEPCGSMHRQATESVEQLPGIPANYTACSV
jgi:hypothetical protein